MSIEQGRFSRRIILPTQSESDIAIVHQITAIGGITTDNKYCQDCEDDERCMMHGLPFGLSLKLGVGKPSNGKRVVRLESRTSAHPTHTFACMWLDDVRVETTTFGTVSFRVKEMWQNTNDLSCNGTCNGNQFLSTQDMKERFLPKCIVPCDFAVHVDFSEENCGTLTVIPCDFTGVTYCAMDVTTIVYKKHFSLPDPEMGPFVQDLLSTSAKKIRTLRDARIKAPEKVTGGASDPRR